MKTVRSGILRIDLDREDPGEIIPLGFPVILEVRPLCGGRYVCTAEAIGRARKLASATRGFEVSITFRQLTDWVCTRKPPKCTEWTD